MFDMSITGALRIVSKYFVLILVWIPNVGRRTIIGLIFLILACWINSLIKNGVTSDFNLKLAELRNADTSSSMSMSNSNTSSLQMPMSTSMPMSMPKSSVPYNYDPFKPYKPKQPVGNDISNRRFQVPESFDEEKVEKYLNEEDFDGGRRRRRTKRRISRNSKKSKKTKRVKRTKRVKKSRKSKKSKTIKY